MRENSVLKERILEFLEFKGVDKAQFYRDTGVSNGVLSQSSGLSEANLMRFLNSYEDVNTEWLFTGIGNMTKKQDSLAEPANVYPLRTDRILRDQSIPLYDIEASAGLVELFRNKNDLTPIDTIRIPNLPKCDGSLFVTGDSMYPLLKSGDIVAYKEINDIENNIFWGEMYLISIDFEGEDFTSVKYIQKSDQGTEYIKLVSQNAHHQPKDIPLKKVRAFALIKSTIRFNSMS